MADTITIPMQPLNIYGELITENGIEVKQAASISVGTDTITIPMQPAGYGSVLITIKMCPYPIPAISADVTGGCVPLQVAFSSTESEFLISRKWDFGDGITSGDESPSIEYTTGGDYTVGLIGYNQAGAKTSDILSIEVLNPPIAGLSADVTAGTSPLTVNFTANCTGDIDNYDWDFGDGVTSGDQNPSHEYTAGTYDVGLIVSNPYCSDDIVLADYIVVSSAAHWESIFSDAYWEPVLFEGDYRAVWTGTNWAPFDHWEGRFIWLHNKYNWTSGYRPTKIRMNIANGNMIFGGLKPDLESGIYIAGGVEGEFTGVVEWDITWGNDDMAYLLLKFDTTDARLTNIEFYVEA